MMTQKIYVVDSDPEILETLLFNIEELGLEADPFTSIDHLITSVIMAPPDLIIMDAGFAQAEGLLLERELAEALPPDVLMPRLVIVNGEKDHAMTEYADSIGNLDLHLKTYDADSLRVLMTDYLPSEDVDI